jgi:3-methyladenine DNA glycosylase AlkD
MQQYMRNQFQFYGIPSPERKLISKELFARHPEIFKTNWRNVVMDCWELPQREMQYVGQEWFYAQRRKFTADDILLIEQLILTKSWWDTVDFVSSNLAGAWFGKFPDDIPDRTRKWMDSGNIWLQRSAVLFQLKYGHKTNQDLLFGFIKELADSKEFFIRKAIGWSLRQLAKTNPQEVLDFVDKQPLSELSRREALKNMQPKALPR